jgi:hypothetical protein
MLNFCHDIGYIVRTTTSALRNEKKELAFVRLSPLTCQLF